MVGFNVVTNGSVGYRFYIHVLSRVNLTIIQFVSLSLPRHTDTATPEATGRGRGVGVVEYQRGELPACGQLVGDEL